MLSQAQSNEVGQHSGSINTSINATNQVGFDCASSNAKSYLLSKLPIFFSTEFGKAGLLNRKYAGQYSLVLVINGNSEITGYQALDGTDENSLLVQTILNLNSLPPLSDSSLCISNIPFIFEFTVK